MTGTTQGGRTPRGRSPCFLTAETPKPLPAPPPSLGQAAISTRTGKPKIIPRAEKAAQARRSRHALCIDHVEVDGLSQKVCIARGRDVADALAEATELNHG